MKQTDGRRSNQQNRTEPRTTPAACPAVDDHRRPVGPLGSRTTRSKAIRRVCAALKRRTAPPVAHQSPQSASPSKHLRRDLSPAARSSFQTKPPRTHQHGRRFRPGRRGAVATIGTVGTLRVSPRALRALCALCALRAVCAVWSPGSKVQVGDKLRVAAATGAIGRHGAGRGIRSIRRCQLQEVCPTCTSQCSMPSGGPSSLTPSP